MQTTLLERIASGPWKRIAILGLTRQGAGKTTTLEHLIRGLQERGIGVGIAAAGREAEEGDFGYPPRLVRLHLREGTIVATTSSALGRATARLETIERTGVDTPQGLVLIVRVLQEGEVEPVGPGAAADLKLVVEAAARQTRGRVLIEGTFNRRAFAAPGIADGIIVVVGASFARDLDRTVAATRYYLDLFSLRATEPRVAELMPAAEAEGAAVMVGADRSVAGGIPWRPRGNAELLLSEPRPHFTHLVVPGSVGDDFVIPILRENHHFEVVVRDPMRLSLSPVYYNAWQKRGGGISVVHRSQVIALSLNPTNPSGPDQDPEEFLRAFREQIPAVPSHDVVLESAPEPPRRRWFGLGGGGR